MAEAARVLDFYEDYQFGTAAPARKGYIGPSPIPVDIPADIPAVKPVDEERVRSRERARAAAAAQSMPAVSLFAILGAVLAGVLMVFVVLAQINYNEIASETTRLQTYHNNLAEKQRRLGITFESVIDMKEVERYARDELGMSKPDADRIAVIRSKPADRAEVIETETKETLREFGSFISSLLEYFKR